MQQPVWLRILHNFLFLSVAYRVVIRVECVEYRTFDLGGDGVVADRRSGQDGGLMGTQENGFSPRTGTLDIRSRYWTKSEPEYPEELEEAGSSSYATLSSDNGEYVSSSDPADGQHAYVTVDRMDKEHTVTINMPRMRMNGKNHLFKKFVIQPVIQYVVQYDKNSQREPHREEVAASTQYEEYDGNQGHDRMIRGHEQKIDRYFNDIDAQFESYWGNSNNEENRGGNGGYQEGGNQAAGYSSGGANGNTEGNSGNQDNNGGGGYATTNQVQQPPNVNAFVSGGGYGDGTNNNAGASSVGNSGSGYNPNGMSLANAMQMSNGQAQFQNQNQQQQAPVGQMYGPPLSAVMGNGGVNGAPSTSGMVVNAGYPSVGGMSQGAPQGMSGGSNQAEGFMGMSNSQSSGQGPQMQMNMGVSSPPNALYGVPGMAAGQPIGPQQMMMMPNSGGAAMGQSVMSQQQAMMQGSMGQTQGMMTSNMHNSANSGMVNSAGLSGGSLATAVAGMMNAAGMENQMGGMAPQMGAMMSNGATAGTGSGGPAMAMSAMSGGAAQMGASAMGMGAVGGQMSMAGGGASQGMTGSGDGSLAALMQALNNMGYMGGSGVAASTSSAGSSPSPSYGPPTMNPSPSHGPPASASGPSPSYGPPTSGNTEPQVSSGGSSSEDEEARPTRGNRGKKPGGRGKPNKGRGGRKSLLASLPKLPASIGGNFSFMFSTAFGRGRRGGRGQGGGSAKPSGSSADGKPTNVDKEQVSDHILNILGLTVHHPPKRDSSTELTNSSTNLILSWEQQGNHASLNHTSHLRGATREEVVAHLPVPEEIFKSTPSSPTSSSEVLHSQQSQVVSETIPTTFPSTDTTILPSEDTESPTTIDYTTLPVENVTITPHLSISSSPPPFPSSSSVPITASSTALPLIASPNGHLRKPKQLFPPPKTISNSFPESPAIYFTPPPPPPSLSSFPTMVTVYDQDPLQEYINHNLSNNIISLQDQQTQKNAQGKPNVAAYYAEPGHHGHPVPVAQFDPWIYDALQAAFQPGETDENGVYFEALKRKKRKRARLPTLIDIQPSRGKQIHPENGRAMKRRQSVDSTTEEI